MESATTPQPATRMLSRALPAGVPGGWVTGNEIYGAGDDHLPDIEPVPMPLTGGEPKVSSSCRRWD